MTPLEMIARALGDRIDAELLPTLIQRVSVPTPVIREELRAAGIPFQDADAGQVYEQADLLESARKVARTGTWRAATVGAVGGALGALAVPPELLVTLAHHFRLAQRLAVVFGIDPDTDAGKLLVARAMAAAYEVELPSQARLELRVRDLPALFGRSLPARTEPGRWVLRQLIARTAGSLTRRASRLVPGLGIGIGAFGAGKRTMAAADRMIEVFDNALESVPFDVGEITDAVEIG
jgi:EcsC protein family